MVVSDPRWVDDVLHFWFDELRPKDWWSADATIDETIRLRFSVLWHRLGAAPPQAGALDARGVLAAVIVLDQFSRHLHRGASMAFSRDALARTLTRDAIERGLDVSLTRSGRHFLYMPLMHGEDATSQALSLRMFERLGDRDALRSAVAHERTFARFGRFPYRNEAMARPSTAEEAAFLAAHAGPE